MTDIPPTLDADPGENTLEDAEPAGLGDDDEADSPKNDRVEDAPNG